ncbi:MAG TPA: sodium/glutamate symporter [Longimicrobiaceae bacterium]|nr:sodium/glutamate symporter [Longimicrobiaceae bacterium]
MLKLDLVHTLAFAGLLLFVGYGIRRAIPPLARYNIPAPVIGGLLVSFAIVAARGSGVTLFEFDTTLQAPLMIAFFTSIGFGASLSLLRVGGPQVLLFFGVATVFAVLQNVVGYLVALPFGVNPLLGVLAGSVTLTGGPATGLAFAPLFEQAGVQGAATVAVAAAMVGIVAGGIIGAPIATRLIERNGLHGPRGMAAAVVAEDELGTRVAAHVVEAHLPDPAPSAPANEDEESYVLLKSLVAILLAMWVGSWLSAWFTSLGLTLPGYIGAMLVAAVFRNLDDFTGWIGLSQRTIDDLGNAALSLFIVLALMTLKLWEISALAGPLFAILAAQVALIVLSFWLIFRIMGRDYDAAVMSGGFCGFMLGTTANAMANMRSLVERYGPAPRAFLVVPMVGAFFIDFTNAVIITVFVNLWR